VISVYVGGYAAPKPYAQRVPAKLYVVHGSHPCMTVARALELKGIPYKRIELPELVHVAHQKLRFGGRTVPGVIFEDGVKAYGSRPLLRLLDERVPEPPLLPADPERRERVLELEAWGDEVLQGVARRLIFFGLSRSPEAVAGYSEGSRWAVPGPIARRAVPGVAKMVLRAHRAVDEDLPRDLEELPGHLARVEAGLDAGILGDDPPNAADLQIAPSVRLLLTLDDVAPLVEAGRAAEWARRLFPDVPGRMPAGTLSR
jgi:glutathione S-transferase